MPRDISKLKASLERLKKQGALLSKDEIENMTDQYLIKEREKLKKYNELMDADWIPKSEKERLKRNTKFGKNTTIEDLNSFESSVKYMKMLRDGKAISSDEDEKPKPKPTKPTKVELKYNELMSADWIPKNEKASLKRNTKDGKKATMEDLIAFEDVNKYMYGDISSDEDEKPKKNVKPKKNDKNIKLFQNVEKIVSKYEKNEPKFNENEMLISKEFMKLLKEGKTISYDKDLGIIMTGKSELKKSKQGKYSVDTELNIKKGLEPKIKKALKKSIIEEAEKKISVSKVSKK